MRTPILCFFSALLLTCNLFAMDSSFDRVVYEDEIVLEPVQAGFGTMTLINDLFRGDDMRGQIIEFMKLGSLAVSVQKLPAKTPYHSKTVRYTFEAWVAQGWTHRIKTGTMVIDCNSVMIIADGGPTECTVVSVVKEGDTTN